MTLSRIRRLFVLALLGLVAVAPLAVAWTIAAEAVEQRRLAAELEIQQAAYAERLILREAEMRANDGAPITAENPEAAAAAVRRSLASAFEGAGALSEPTIEAGPETVAVNWSWRGREVQWRDGLSRLAREARGLRFASLELRAIELQDPVMVEARAEARVRWRAEP